MPKNTPDRQGKPGKGPVSKGSRAKGYTSSDRVWNAAVDAQKRESAKRVTGHKQRDTTKKR